MVNVTENRFERVAERRKQVLDPAVWDQQEKKWMILCVPTTLHQICALSLRKGRFLRYLAKGDCALSQRVEGFQDC